MIKMKFIGLILVMLGFHTISISQTTRSQTLLELNLKGNVKFLSQLDQELSISKNIKNIGDTLAYKEYHFNNKGRVSRALLIEYATNDPIIVIYDVMGYDSIIVKNEVDSTFYINEYWNGLLMKSEEDSIGKGPRPFKRFGYDPNNKRSFETSYNSDKRLIYAYNYLYNSKGLLIEDRLSCCDPKSQNYFNTLVGFQYEYDNHFNIIKSIEYTPDFKQKRTHFYTYHQGKVVKDSLVTYFYDKTFKRNKKMQLENQNCLVTYTYDGNGNVIKEIWEYEFAKTKIETYSYTWDTKNNWTERIRFCNGEAIQITKRQINY